MIAARYLSRAVGALSLLALGAMPIAAQSGWGFAPRSQRTSDAVINRDLARFDSLSTAANSSRARLYVGLAREAYERNDDGELSASLLDASVPGAVLPHTRRPELWAELQTARANPSAPVALLDALEAALLRAEHPLLGAPSCARWELIADSLATELRAARQSPAPPPVASEPAPPPAPVRVRGPLPDRVHFALDQATLSAASRVVLDAVVDSLRDRGPVTIVLEGHTDRRASDAYNLALSSRRAESVRAYLVTRGIVADQVTMSALGRSALLEPGVSIGAHARNRRVVMRFTAADGTVLLTMSQEEDLQPEQR
jgi:outer membrane protein OmpA-like peptidoglycan-associated protein